MSTELRTKIQRHLRTLAADWRTWGPGYATAEALATLGDRLVVGPMQDRLLSIEGQRGILGRAHRTYNGHSIALNRETWTGHTWRSDADDFTSSKDWKDAIVEGLLRPTMSPGGVILEIGPGGGRWSNYLVQWADELVLVDITDRTLSLCRDRLQNAGRVRFIQNHGSDLPGVAEASIDRIWSFDVFVHIAPVDIASYMNEIARVLRPGGIAVIHHSGVSRIRPNHEGWRSPMTARLFANLAAQRKLAVQRQLTSGELPLGFDDVTTILVKV